MGSGSSKASSTASNPRPLSASQTSLAVGRRPAAPHKSQRNPLQACVSSAATLVSASTRSQEAEEKPSDTDNSPSPSETPTNPLGTDALVTHSPIQRAFAPPTPPLPILRPSSGKHRPGSGGLPRLIPSLAPTPHESSLTQHISYFRSYLQSRMSDGDGMENACPSENNQGGRVLTSAEVKAVMALALDLSEVAGRQPRESGDDLSGQSPTTTSTDRLMVVNDEKDDAHVLLRELMEEDHPFEPSHFTTYQREGNTVGFQLDEKDRPAGVSAKAVSTIEQSSQLGISSTITSRSHGHSAHRRQRTHVHKLFHCPTVQASPIVGSEGLRSNEGSPISNPFALCVEQAECIAATHDAINGVSAVAMDISAMLQSWILLLDQYDLFSKDLITEVIATCPSSREELLPQVSVPNKIMGMIHLAVVQYTKPDEILSVLTEAGARHRLYGVHHEHYVILQNAFMRVYPKYLPDDVYHRTDAMWKIFWRSIIELLSKGAQTERGAIFEQEHRVAWSHHIQSIMSVLAERQCGNADDDREHFFFSEMYQKAKKMANDTSDTSLQKMVERFAAVSSARTGDRAMNALLRIVDNLEDEAAVDDYLDDLGEQHMLLGLNMAIMNHFRQPFLDTCGHYMHNHELWTPNAQHAMGEFWDYMVEAWNDEFSNAHLSGTLDLKNVGAPDSAEPFCLIFTDVEASTRLWQSNHEVMAAAIQNHHRIIRGVVTDYNGYEVKTVGDSFLIATKDALTALKIALAIQLEFMRVPITEGFKMIDNPQGGGDPVCWRDDSLRIRIGIHYCTDVSAVYDTVHQRYDYYGPDVNCAARVEASACGGQVLMTKAALDALHAIPGFMTEPRPRLLTGYDIGTTNERSITFSCLLDKSLPGTPSSPATPSVRPLSSYVSFKDVGPRELKGITEPMQLFEVVHSALGGRMFDARAHEMTSFAVLTTFPLDQADSGKFCLSEQ